jgi:hypothetical protein
VSTVGEFISLLNARGSNARYRRADSVIECPCRTPEGFRDPEWHILHPTEPVCDESGHLPDSAHSVDMVVKAFVQPVQSTRATRLSVEYIAQLFETVQADDHLGIFPESWAGKALDFRDWSMSGEDFIEYDGQRFICVNANLIPDPSDGNPRHHWECGLRLINDEAL